MRKLLKIKEKNKKIYQNYNEKHKNFDRIIRVSAGFVPLIGYIFKSNWITELWIISFVLIICSLIFSAIMEFRYAEDPNVYKLVISHIIFLIVFFLTVLYALYNTHFFEFLK